MKHVMRNCFLLAMLVCIVTGMGKAQVTSATVTGVISDHTGAVIGDTSVSLTNLNTGVISKTTTNAQGVYRISGLINGIYKETLSKGQFKSISKDQIELHSGDVVELSFVLEVGSTTETVTVAAGEPIIDTQSTTVGVTIEGRQVEEAPLNGRNTMNLIALSPGVVPGGSSQGAAVASMSGGRFNPAGMGNYTIGGAVSGWNSTMLDGAPLNATGQNWQMFTPSQDAVAEFHVDTNAPSAQYGRFAGGVTNFTTKSGTNKFHGSAYEYVRNTLLNGNTFANNRTNQARPANHQNQFGATLGGPIFKNKSFFFGSWESLRINSQSTSNIRVPTLTEMSGDFTASSTPVMDLKTGLQAQCNGLLNKFCASQLDPVPMELYNLHYMAPLETDPVKLAKIRSTGQDVNATVLQKQGNNSAEYTVRVDHELNSKQRLFGRYTRWAIDIPLSAQLTSPAVPSGPQKLRTQQYVLGDNYTISPTLNADIRASYSGFKFDFDNAGFGNWNVAQLGPNWATLATSLLHKSPPTIARGSWNYMSGFDNMDQHNYDDQYAVSVNLTKVSGHHSIQFGGEARRLEFYSVSNMGTGGQFFFPGLAAFVEGTFTGRGTGTVMSQSLVPQAYSYYQGYYLTDSLQVSPRLTANIGVRWELPGAWMERKDRDAVLLPNKVNPLGTFANPVAGGPTVLMGIIAPVNSADYISRKQTQNHLNLFEPRVGLNYSVNPQTVVMAGFGLTHPCLDCGSAEMTVASSAFETATTITPTPLTTPTTTLYPNGGTYGVLSNPYPNGVAVPTGRSTTSMQPYSQNPLTLIGQSISGQVPTGPYTYVLQWNGSVERAIGSSTSARVSYVGSRGVHLNTMDVNLNQLPNIYNSMGTALNAPVANPLKGIASPLGSVGGTTAMTGRFLMPFPEFTTVSANGLPYGESDYHSMISQIKKRFAGGSMVSALYTWSHLISNEDTQNGYLEGGMSNTGVGPQDYTNHKADKSNSTSDLRQRFLVEYILDLPVGRGKRFLGNSNRVLDAAIGGWSVSGITILQTGTPLAMTTQNGNQLSSNFGAGAIRPNVVAGVSKKGTGSRYSRTLPGNTWFNTAAFSTPGAYQYGNESRVDSTLRTDNTKNWDMNLAKSFSAFESFKLQFKAEFFNVFNRQSYGVGGLNVDNPAQFGVNAGAANSSRVGQMSLRVNY